MSPDTPADPRARVQTGLPLRTRISCCRDELRPVRSAARTAQASRWRLDEAGDRKRRSCCLAARAFPQPANRKTPRAPRRLAELSRYYAESARILRELMTSKIHGSVAGKHEVIVTGGGPGVMEAGNRGAMDAGGKSIGLNIVLPHEQAPNEYVTPELCFNFHYFGDPQDAFPDARHRDLRLSGRLSARMDETFEALTLIQTGRMARSAVLAVRRGVLAAASSTGTCWPRRARFRQTTLRCSDLSKPHKRRLQRWKAGKAKAKNAVNCQGVNRRAALREIASAGLAGA